jgi:hypothetical protein
VTRRMVRRCDELLADLYSYECELMDGFETVERYRARVLQIRGGEGGGESTWDLSEDVRKFLASRE